MPGSTTNNNQSVFSRIWNWATNKNNAPTNANAAVVPPARPVLRFTISQEQKEVKSANPSEPITQLTAARVIRNLSDSVAKAEAWLRNIMKDFLDQGIYQSAIINGPRDANGRYLNITEDKNEPLYYYLHCLNLLIDLQQTLPPFADVQEIYLALIRKTPSKYGKLWQGGRKFFSAEGGKANEKINLLDKALNRFLESFSKLELDTLPARLPGFKEIGEYIKNLPFLDTASEQMGNNPLYASYKKNGDHWREVFGLPPAQHPELKGTEDDAEEYDLVWDKPGLFSEEFIKEKASEMLKDFPVRVDGIYTALGVILKDLSGEAVTPEVQKDFDKAVQAIKKIQTKLEKFLTKKFTWKNILNFVYQMIPLIKDLVASLPQSYVAVNRLLHENLMITVRQMNLIIQDCFLYVDRNESRFLLKDGSAVTFGAGKRGCGLLRMIQSPMDNLPQVDKLLGENKDAYIVFGDTFFYVSRHENQVRLKELDVNPAITVVVANQPLFNVPVNLYEEEKEQGEQKADAPLMLEKPADGAYLRMKLGLKPEAEVKQEEGWVYIKLNKGQSQYIKSLTGHARHAERFDDYNFSLSGLAKVFNDWIEGQGYELPLEERFPYYDPLTKQRNELKNQHQAQLNVNNKGQENKRDESSVEMLRLHQLERRENDLMEKGRSAQAASRETLDQEITKLNKVKNEILRVQIESCIKKLESECEALENTWGRWLADFLGLTRSKDRKIGLLKVLNTALNKRRQEGEVVPRVEAAMQDLKSVGARVDYLLKGRTGKMVKTLQALTATPEDRIQLITKKTQDLQLEYSMDPQYLFFAEWRNKRRRAKLRQRIPALEKLREWMEKPGYRVQECLGYIKAKSGSQFRVLNKETQLLDALREIDGLRPDFVVGKKKRNLRAKTEPQKAEEEETPEELKEAKSALPPEEVKPANPPAAPKVSGAQVIRNISTSVGNTEAWLRNLMKDFLDEEVYTAAIVNGPRDVNGRYTQISDDKEEPLHYYLHCLNLLIELQQLLPPFADVEEIYLKIMQENHSVYGQIWDAGKVFFTKKGSVANEKINLLDRAISRFIETFNKLELDAMPARLPGIKEVGKMIRDLPFLETARAQRDQNPFYLSYKKNGDQWREALGLPPAKSPAELKAMEDDSDEYDLVWEKPGIFSEEFIKEKAGEILKDFPERVDGIYKALSVILKDLSGDDLTPEVKKSFEKSKEAIKKIQNKLKKFLGKKLTWQNILGFIYEMIPLIQDLAASFPQSYTAVSKLLHENLMITARELNLIVRDCFLYVDRKESQFLLKDGSMALLGAGTRGCGLLRMTKPPMDNLPQVDKLLGDRKDAYIVFQDIFYYVCRNETQLRLKELEINPTLKVVVANQPLLTLPVDLNPQAPDLAEQKYSSPVLMEKQADAAYLRAKLDIKPEAELKQEDGWVHIHLNQGYLQYIKSLTGHARNAERYDDYNFSLSGIAKGFNDWIEGRGYGLPDDERYPFYDPLSKQRDDLLLQHQSKLAANNGQESKREPSPAEAIRLHQLESRAGLMKKKSSAQKYNKKKNDTDETKKSNTDKREILRVQIDGQIKKLESECEALEGQWSRWIAGFFTLTSTKHQKITLLHDLTAELGKRAQNGETVPRVEAALQTMKAAGKKVGLLLKGRTGKMVKTLQALTATPEDRILLITKEIQNLQLECQQDGQYFFFAEWRNNRRREKLEKRIQALEKFREYMEKPGYRVQECLDYVKAKLGPRFTVLSKETEDALREIDALKPDSVVGKKHLNFFAKAEEQKAEVVQPAMLAANVAVLSS